jgi:hypothetical protein
MLHFSSELITTVMAHYKMRNLETMLVFDFLSGGAVLMLYASIAQNRILKLIIQAMLPIYIISSLVVYFSFDNKLFIPSYTFAWFHLFMLVPIMLYFTERMMLLDDIYIHRNPMFWISAGLLLFYSVSIFYFALNNYLYTNYIKISRLAVLINSSMLLTMNILLAIGIWKIPKE